MVYGMKTGITVTAGKSIWVLKYINVARKQIIVMFDWVSVDSGWKCRVSGGGQFKCLPDCGTE
jgi:hypothetical protein